MGQPLIIGISGLRGIIAENLTPAIAAEYAAAFGEYLKRTSEKKGPLSVCIGRDSRPSGAMINSAVIAGLSASGINTIDLGVVTTPSVGIMVRHLDCDGGVIITASHNPVQFNGIKLLRLDAMAPPKEAAGQIKALYEAKDFSFVDSISCGKITGNTDTDEIHIEKVLKLINPQKIGEKNFKVVLDSVNGAGAAITKKLLGKLNCNTVPVNDEPTGLFAHEPEPTAENLSGLCGIVTEHKADVGFAQDPDADRLAIIDEAGRYIGEEYTLALAVRYILSKTKGPVAANLSTSRMVDDIASAAGCEVIRTAVGEANVASAMKEHNCVIGGEGNGGVIHLEIGPIRDSLVAIVLILQLMAETGKSISQLTDEIPAYTVIKHKFQADPGITQKLLEAAKAQFSNARINTSDGVRFDFEDSWLHLRSSNTEPVMRAIAEAKDEQTAQGYIDKINDLRKAMQ